MLKAYFSRDFDTFERTSGYDVMRALLRASSGCALGYGKACSKVVVAGVAAPVAQPALAAYA
jgi:hypothetical protein